MCKAVMSELILTLSVPGEEAMSVKLPLKVHFPKRLREQIGELIQDDGLELLFNFALDIPEAEVAEDTFF